MKNYGIKIRNLSEANTLNNLKRKIVIPKQKLKELYLDKRLSSLQIARMYNCRHITILKRLEENGIKRRDAVKSNTKYPKKDFEGSTADKAYMLGFALGDLHVYKPNKKGKTIVMEGGSTIKEQITLIEKLFAKYGHIRSRDIEEGFIAGKRIIANLNESFDFLLYKKDKIPAWVVSNKQNFFAFLAGYIDAEGHIRTKIPALVLINSYDKGILKDIYKNCIKYGLENPRLRIAAKKGYKSLKKVKPYKKDMWQFGVYSKKSLLKLFNEVQPYLRHENKIDSILKARDQINYRNERYGFQRMGG